MRKRFSARRNFTGRGRAPARRTIVAARCGGPLCRGFAAAWLVITVVAVLRVAASPRPGLVIRAVVAVPCVAALPRPGWLG